VVFQADPLLCCLVVIGKGTLAGLASGLVYKLFSKWNKYLAMLLAAIICPVINTGVFVACMLLLFREVLSAWANGADLVTYIFSGLLLFNFVPELIINVVFSPASATILKLVKKN